MLIFLTGGYFETGTIMSQIYIVITILIIPHGTSSLLNLPSTKRNSEVFDYIYQRANAEKAYRTILILTNSDITQFVEGNLLQPSLPKLLLFAGHSIEDETTYNSNVLAIIALDSSQNITELLDTLLGTLQHMRQTHIIILAENIGNLSALLEQLTVYFAVNHLTNIVVILPDYGEEEGIYFHCHIFPTYKMVKRSIKQSAADDEDTIFPEQWRNMKGKPILVLPDQSAPKSFIFTDRSGRKHLSGYIGKLAGALAKQCNGTLRFPWSVEEGLLIHGRIIKELAENYTIDFGVTASAPKNTFFNMTYPFEISRWLVMVPCVRKIPLADIYLIVIETNLILLLVVLVMVLSLMHTLIEFIYFNKLRGKNVHFNWTHLLNDSVLPGILGQTFKVRPLPLASIKLIYFVIFLTGIVLNTLYGSQLGTLFAQQPLEPQIQTYADLKRTKTNLAVVDAEVQIIQNNVNSSVFGEIEQVLAVLPHEMFNKYRRRLNTSYGYTVSESQWSLFAAQQLYFKRKLFCVPEKLVLQTHLMFTLPLAQDSIYREPLNELISWVQAAGLIQHWKTMSFLEMLQNHMITLKDPSPTKMREELKLGDLIWVWTIVCIGYCLAICVFITEIWIFYMRSCQIWTKANE